MLRLLFALCLFVTATEAATPVEGHVVNTVTGAPIAGVSVRLMQDGDEFYSTTSDVQGNFRFPSVQDGEYNIFYRAAEFSRPLPFIKVLIGPGGPPAPIELKMTPMPRLSGKVLDAAGRLVPNASVSVLDSDFTCGARPCYTTFTTVKTDENGEYLIHNIATYQGTSILCATAPASWDPPAANEGDRMGWAQTFYPGATDPELGTRLVVPPGGDLWNIDIKLKTLPVHGVRGVVLDTEGNPVRATVIMGSGFGPSLQQETTGEGTFEFPSVPEGEWRLSARAERNSVKLWASLTLRVKDRDSDPLELRLTAPFSLRGVMVGAKVAQPPDILIEDAGGPRLEDTPRASIGTNDGKGGFTFKDIYPGMHRVMVLDAYPRSYYLDSVTVGTVDGLGPSVPILSSAQPVTITYKQDGGSVRGKVEGCGKGRVLLIPADSGLQLSAFARGAECGLNGQFQFDAVRPGEYYGLAFDGNGEVPNLATFRDQDKLRRLAAPVTVRAGEAATAEIRLVWDFH